MKDFQQFVSVIKRNGIAKATHFFCDITPPPFMITTASTAVQTIIPFYVESTNIPEFSLFTQTVKEAGLNREAVYDKSYGSVTLNLYSDMDMTVKKFFDDWTMSAVMKTGGKFMYPSQYIAESLPIYIVNPAGSPTYFVILRNVYPKLVNDISLSSSAPNSAIRFSVMFTYESWESYQFSTAVELSPTPGSVNITGNSGTAVSNKTPDLSRAWNFIQLVRTGANKDALRSMLINVGTRKIFDVLGRTGTDARIARAADNIIGKSGLGNVLGALDGIIL